jgi:hypothetical protein
MLNPGLGSREVIGNRVPMLCTSFGALVRLLIGECGEDGSKGVGELRSRIARALSSKLLPALIPALSGSTA